MAASINNKHKTNVAERFVRDNVFGVLLNLDPAPWDAFGTWTMLHAEPCRSILPSRLTGQPKCEHHQLVQRRPTGISQQKSAAFPFVTCSLEKGQMDADISFSFIFNVCVCRRPVLELCCLIARGPNTQRMKKTARMKMNEHMHAIARTNVTFSF